MCAEPLRGALRTGGSGGGRVPLGPSQRRAAAVRGRPHPARSAAPRPARPGPRPPPAACPNAPLQNAPATRLGQHPPAGRAAPAHLGADTDVFPAPKAHVKLTPSASRVFVVVVGLGLFFFFSFLHFPLRFYFYSPPTTTTRKGSVPRQPRPGLATIIHKKRTSTRA